MKSSNPHDIFPIFVAYARKNAHFLDGKRRPQGMRLAPDDAAPERGLLEKAELMGEPTLGLSIGSGGDGDAATLQ